MLISFRMGYDGPRTSSKKRVFKDLEKPVEPRLVSCKALKDWSILPFVEDYVMKIYTPFPLTIAPGITTQKLEFSLTIEPGFYMTIETAYALASEGITILDQSFAGTCESFSITFNNTSGSPKPYYSLTQIAKCMLHRYVAFDLRSLVPTNAPGMRSEAAYFRQPPFQPKQPVIGVYDPPNNQETIEEPMEDPERPKTPNLGFNQDGKFSKEFGNFTNSFGGTSFRNLKTKTTKKPPGFQNNDLKDKENDGIYSIVNSLKSITVTDSYEPVIHKRLMLNDPILYRINEEATPTNESFITKDDTMTSNISNETKSVGFTSYHGSASV